MTTRYYKRRESRLNLGDLVRYWSEPQEKWILAIVIGTWSYGPYSGHGVCQQYIRYMGRSPQKTKKDIGYLLFNFGDCHTSLKHAHFSDYAPGAELWHHVNLTSDRVLEIIQAHK